MKFPNSSREWDAAWKESYWAQAHADKTLRAALKKQINTNQHQYTMTTTTETMTVGEIAEMFDCAIIRDKDGHIAIQERIYDDEGIQQVRYRPDPCDFRAESWWEAADIIQIARAIC